MKEGFILEREEEKDFFLSEIIDENRVYIKSSDKSKINNLNEINEINMDYKKDNMHQSNNLDKPPAEIPVINNNKFNYVINKPNNELKKIVNKEINNISIIKTEINNNKEIVKSIDGGSKSNGIKIYINGNYKFTKNYEKIYH